MKSKNKLLPDWRDCFFNAVINKKNAKQEYFIRKTEEERQEKGEFEDDELAEINTDMLSSFYISDIDMIRRNIQTGDRIVHYIEALKKPSSNRIEIDTDVQHMKAWLSPERYPLGKWPSSNSPSLMQQIAINIAISNHENSSGFFSVNGPPGTGKTTLVKEIIASYVVERALLLSKYHKPDDAFQQCQFTAPENDYLKTFYRLDDKLIKYGIIVASNNNSAVENISKELPIAKNVKKSNTKLFNVDENKEIYFSNIAKTLMGNDEECWGLISARLGKKSNIKELKDALWFNKEGVNLKQLFKEDPPDWDQAKKAFIEKYSEVVQYRRMIEDAVQNTNKHTLIKEEHNIAENSMVKAKNEMIKHEYLLHQKVKEQNDLKLQIETFEQNKKLLYKRLPLFKRLFPFLFRRDPLIIKIKQTNQKLNLAAINLTCNRSNYMSVK